MASRGSSPRGMAAWTCVHLGHSAALRTRCCQPPLGGHGLFLRPIKDDSFPPALARLCLVHLGTKTGAGKARAGRQSWRAPVLPPGRAEPMSSVSACASGAPAPDQPRHPLALLHGARVRSQPLSSGCPGIGWCVGFVCVGFGSRGGATAVGGPCERTP